MEERKVIRILLHGSCGQMGRAITRLASKDERVKIVAGVDPHPVGTSDYPTFSCMEACDAKADVVIDVSCASAVCGMLQGCIKRKLPVVLCTTGLGKREEQAIKEAGEKVAVLQSANLSLGINLLLQLLPKAARLLVPAQFDVELLERHHRKKIDAPSGTALALADAVNSGQGAPFSYRYDRSGERSERRKEEIGIAALRGGTIPGEHEVMFAGEDEVITFQHKAYSKDVFGRGALEAAKFLAGKEEGLYTMNDVLELEKISTLSM